ncbi:hypothetical protein IFR04_000755 [Cadophora malorum]|uniref:Uncharacterized protein n=1 Tax=Cadophora malorum TaxID=108018 RepID=A0A8H7WJY6_9HELO|nr:hypothetical protein IFR04_000755 [Cadophora malorum]
MSTLLPNKGASLAANARNMNDQVRKAVVPHYRGINQKLMLAEMDDGFITLDDLGDETHPNDAGYKKMAAVWWAAFQEVERNGWLSPPQDNGLTDSSSTTVYTCPKTLAIGTAPVKIQRGSGTDDGPYTHSSQDQGVVGGNGNTFGLRDRDDCTDARIRSDAPITGPDAITVEAEHIIERVTIAEFFTFIQNPELDLEDGNGLTRVPGSVRPIDFSIIAERMAEPYRNWARTPEGQDLPAVQSLFYDIAQALGSDENTASMTNLEADVNNVKSRVLANYGEVTSDEVFRPLATNPTTENTEAALMLLRTGVSVFNYLNDDVIQILMGGINRDLRADMNLFDTFYNQDVTIPQKFTIVESLWVYFINFWATRMENRHRAYFSRRINELLTPWQDVLDGNPSPATQQVAEQAMEDIRLVADLYAEIRFEKRNLT